MSAGTFALYRANAASRTAYVGSGDCPHCRAPFWVEADVAIAPGTQQKHFAGRVYRAEVREREPKKVTPQPVPTGELEFGDALPFDDALPPTEGTDGR